MGTFGCGLERAIPVAEVHVGLAHLHVMVACVDDELGRLVEAHGLAVQDGGAEDIRIVAFHPSGGIDEQGEARRMAFGEAVLAEALDLAEAACDELGVVAAGCHVSDERLTVFVNVAVVAEGGHGAAQPVRLVGRELGGGDGDLHRLLLEQRHAARPLQHILQFVLVAMPGGRGGIDDGFGILVSPLEIGMHHVALDRAGANDGDLDDEIVEFLRSQSRQHRHLRAALHLEHADGVGLRQHRVDFIRVGGAVSRNSRERERSFIMGAKKVEAAAQGAQHAEGQHVDFHQAQRIDVVLVPFDVRAFVHGGPGDGDRLVEASFGEDEASDVLGEMTGEADQLTRELDRLANFRIGGIEAGFADVRVGQAVGVAAPDCPGDSGGDVGREAHDFSHLADGAARAIMDDGGADGGVFAAISLVDVLDDLLAAVVLEIYVDIGWLLTFGRDETREEKVGGGWVDLGDAEAIADGAVGGRSAALAQDLFAAREADDVVDGEEIARVVELGDERQLLADLLFDFLRNAARITLAGADPGQILEMLLGCLVWRHRLVWIFVLEIGQGEAASARNIEGARQGFGISLEQERHFCGRLHVPLGVGGEAEARFGNRACLADAGDDIGKRAALRSVIVHVIDGDEGRAGASSKLVEHADAARLVASMVMNAGEVAAPRRSAGELLEMLGEGGRKLAGRERDEDLAVRSRENVLERQMAFGVCLVGGLEPAFAQEAAKARVGFPVAGICEGLEAIEGDETHADDELETGGLAVLPRPKGAHDASEAVAIGDGQRIEAEIFRSAHHLFRMGGTPEEREVRGDGKLGIAGHARPFRQRRAHFFLRAALASLRRALPALNETRAALLMRRARVRTSGE